MNNKHPIISLLSGFATTILIVIVPLFIIKWVVFSFNPADIITASVAVAITGAIKLKDKDLI